jgi:hypothetical protein
MAIQISRKKSVLNCSNIPLFFSLVDYRNNYFTSNEPERIIEFYNGFENRDQLIQWMKERPKGVANIHEVDGDRDIIVVIPTADFNGKYARECRDNIFKGLHIVFVESGEIPDPYFNYAHNCNVGIRKAMEYNPKWVVVSNDDMGYVDSPTKLRMELDKVDDAQDIVFCNETIYHSYKTWISRIRPIYFLRMKFSKNAYYARLLKAFSIEYATVGENKRSLSIRLYNDGYFKNIFWIRQIGSFGIFSSKYISRANVNVFDETYINHMEDLDLSLRIFVVKTKFAFIDYNIRDIIGGTIGNEYQRKLRSIASQAYFQHKNVKMFYNFRYQLE